MLWEVEIHPITGEVDREGQRVLAEAQAQGAASVRTIRAARSFLVDGDLDEATVKSRVVRLLADGIVETCQVRSLPAAPESAAHPVVPGLNLVNVLFKPGVTDNVAETAASALRAQGLKVTRVATCRKYWINADAAAPDLQRLSRRVLANDAIEQLLTGALILNTIAVGSEYKFQLTTVAISTMDDAALMHLSKHGQLYLSLAEMQTIKQHFIEQHRDPTDIELETVAQTWSEHCSHKTLKGRIAYRDENGTRQFENMLKETVFGATQTLRKKFGANDWCVSVFKDNAGVVTFNDTYDICFKVETHNHPSAIEPYGGANTGLGGVIRDPIGTGMGAKPVCNTDVFCFAPPDTPDSELPPGVLHPRTVMRGVVSGVRDYGNRMGIPTVNGAVFFDERYIGNPLVYCGNVALLPVGMSEKHVQAGDLIVAVGGRTGRDGIHGATFSSVELDQESETISGGAVQIGNAVQEKMILDVIMEARDRGLYRSITDCGAGGFSSAVGEMGEESGAEVWLDKCPLKYSGLSYTEIWISEAQERMVLAVPPEKWEAFHRLCASEGVEAVAFGRFSNDQRLRLFYHGEQVGNVAMSFLHDGRPPVNREAVYIPPKESTQLTASSKTASSVGPDDFNRTLKKILGSLNVCSKEWIIRQYDHEVQAGSVVKPLVGVANDGPSDAAVVRPDLGSMRGAVISNGMNPRYGDFDPYWMAAAAIDEALRNCVAVGADPAKIAILDNFCWGNTERPETLGSLVRAALGCHDAALAYNTPFISGKDSLNNEFKYDDSHGQKQVITIPSSLLISAIGQIENVENAVTMDLKEAGNRLILVGQTKSELGGSHFTFVQELTGGTVPRVDFKQAPQTLQGVHQVLAAGLVRSCHDLSEGGLALALAEMAFAGGLGIEASIAGVCPESSDAVDALFSESQTRFVLEVESQHVDRVLATLKATGTLAVNIGSVTPDTRLNIVGSTGAVLIDADLADLKASWQLPLKW
ncbi:MAG: phosphoribosylformylglycinamidine synthase subunit PurL [Planctomycetota bacterium]|nr:MAG: phosphoribosylformylglycinamidine synthase subunit PurL [Planctomycetota bacterium]